MTTKQDLHRLVDQLPESTLPEAAKLLEELRGDDELPAVFRDAPEDDDPLTADELKGLEEAREDIRAGRLVSHEEARRRLLGA